MATQDIQTVTGLAAGATTSAAIDGLHNYDKVHVLVDDNAGGAPASYDLEYESTNATTGTASMQVDTLSASTARHHVFDAVPWDGTFTLTNSSGASADYRIRVVAVDEQT